MPKTRGRKPTAVDPQLKKLEQENRRLTSRLRRAEALLAFQKKFPSSYRFRERRGRLMILDETPTWVPHRRVGCWASRGPRCTGALRCAPAPGATPRLGRLMIAVRRGDAHTGCRTGVSGVGPLEGLAVSGASRLKIARPRPAPPRALDRSSVSRLRSRLHRASSIRRRRRCTPRCSMRGPTSVQPSLRRCIASSTLRTRSKSLRNQVRRPHYAAPELLATRPNAVWSWDITKLRGPATWTYFYLYVIARHLQSLRGRLDDRAARECGPRRASHRRHLRQARHSPGPAHAPKVRTAARR